MHNLFFSECLIRLPLKSRYVLKKKSPFSQLIKYKLILRGFNMCVFMTSNLNVPWQLIWLPPAYETSAVLPSRAERNVELILY